MKRTGFTQKQRKPIRQVSKKRAARAVSEQGLADAAYLAAVRGLPCAACGAVGRTEAHHPRDSPPHAEQGLYDRLPCAGRKSSNRDAIPLCGPDGCHQMYHMERAKFHSLYGRDYTYIGTTRADLAHMELDF